MADMDAVFAALDHMERQAIAGALTGARIGARELQEAGQATTAYSGMSGATRASTVAYVIGAGADDSAAFERAYQEASALLTGFTGHAGKPSRESLGSVKADEIVIIFTVPTNYIVNLETDNAGQKAFIAPTFDAYAPAIGQHIADGIRRELT